MSQPRRTREHFTSLPNTQNYHRHPDCACALGRDDEGRVRMWLCPLHAQAPALREALANLLEYNDQLRLSHLRPDLLHESDSEAAARAVLKACEP